MTTTYKVTFDTCIYVMTDDDPLEAVKIACGKLSNTEDPFNQHINCEALEEEPQDEIVYMDNATMQRVYKAIDKPIPKPFEPPEYGHSHGLIDTGKQEGTLDYFRLALGNCVSEVPPEDIREWDDEKLNDWVEEHAWEPFEGWPASDILDHADDMEQQFKIVAQKLANNAKETKELNDAEV